MTLHRLNLHRSGFTMIEMIMVVTIAMTLVLLSAGSVMERMREAAVEGAAAEIVALSERARGMALNNIDDDIRYGVLIVDDGSQPATVTLVQRESGATSPVMNSDNSKPLERAVLPTTAMLMIGGRLLSDVASDPEDEGPVTSLEWFYTNGTGKVLKATGSTYASHPVGVGMRTPDITQNQGGTALWGLEMNRLDTASASAPDFTIAPEFAGRPGLSVRSVDGKFNVGVTVYPVGIAFTHDFKEE